MVRFERLRRFFAGTDGKTGKDYIQAYFRENDPVAQLLNHIVDTDKPDIDTTQGMVDAYFIAGFPHVLNQTLALNLHDHAMRVLPPTKYAQYARILYKNGRSWDRPEWYPNVLESLRTALKDSSEVTEAQFVAELLSGGVPVVYSLTGSLRVQKYLWGDEQDNLDIYQNIERDTSDDVD